MSDLVKREDVLNTLLQMDGTKIDKALAMGEIRSIPPVDRPQIYCYGWVDSMTDEPLGECLNCKDFVYGAQIERDTNCTE